MEIFFMSDTLYDRLGGYDAIAAVAKELVSRLHADEKLGRFWAHRGDDGIARELQLLIDFLCHVADGPAYYTGRNMKLAHTGMHIGKADWAAMTGHLEGTLDTFSVAETERRDVLDFVESLQSDIVEA